MSFSYLLCFESYTVVIIKKSANPTNHYSGLALPLYTMDESALKTHTPLCIDCSQYSLSRCKFE